MIYVAARGSESFVGFGDRGLREVDGARRGRREQRGHLRDGRCGVAREDPGIAEHLRHRERDIVHYGLSVRAFSRLPVCAQDAGGAGSRDFLGREPGRRFIYDEPMRPGAGRGEAEDQCGEYNGDAGFHNDGTMVLEEGDVPAVPSMPMLLNVAPDETVAEIYCVQYIVAVPVEK